MALLAAPSKSAFCITEKDAGILNKKSSAVLNALQRIRKAEARSGDTVRLHQLDGKIRALESEYGSRKK